MHDRANTHLRRLCGVIAVAFALGACSSGGGGEGSIDPNDGNAVMQAMNVKLGGQDAVLKDGDPPESKGEAGEPEIMNLPESESVSPGEQKTIAFDTNQDSPLKALYAKVAGSNSFFEATLASTQSLATKRAAGDIEFDIEIPSNLGSGTFCVQVSVEDEDVRVSPVREICFTNAGDGGADAEVLQRAQGTWQRCEGVSEDSSFRERISFDGNTAFLTFTSFDQENCMGTGQQQGSQTASLTVGAKVQTTGGQIADEVDVVVQSSDGISAEEPGDEFFDIIWINDSRTELVLGDNAGERPEDRPDTLGFDTRSFAPVN